MQETIIKSLVFDSNTSSSDSLPTISNTKTTDHQCKICGSPALHSNYGAMSCSSCKIFFKRNAVKKQENFPCHFNGDCEINIHNRHICSPCRLTKCFTHGMQSELIRCPRSKQNTSSHTTDTLATSSNIKLRTDEQHQLSTTNLLQSDNSTLTTDQWTLLSNLIYNYDESKILSIAQQFINVHDDSQTIEINDSTLSKEFFMKVYEISGTYILSNGDFCTLSSDDRSNFLRNITENVTCLGVGFSWSRSQVYHCQPFIDFCINMYGENLVTMIHKILKFIDSDIVIAKLALSLFAFSNNNSILSTNMIIEPINTLAIFHIQNLYAEVIWKYLLYKYGYHQSIQRFINLNQSLLAATNTVYDAQNIDKHVNDINSLIERTELSLALDDFERID